MGHRELTSEEIKSLWSRFHMGMLACLALVLGVVAVIAFSMLQCVPAAPAAAPVLVPEAPPDGSSESQLAEDGLEFITSLITILPAGVQAIGDREMVVDAIYRFGDFPEGYQGLEANLNYQGTAVITAQPAGICSSDTMRTAKVSETTLDLLDLPKGSYVSHTYLHTPSESYYIVMIDRSDKEPSVEAVCTAR